MQDRHSGIFPAGFVVITEAPGTMTLAEFLAETPPAEGVAKFDFVGEAGDEISFAEGDLVTQIEATKTAEWLKGICNGQYGLFPSDYVTLRRTKKAELPGYVQRLLD
eukprot:c7217_g1_i1.p2 GENE.c7217_g1_i1~~c7217_g1_i1.p2  ORF type:complete len:107 (+),score=26.64 c7217_g1_i1:89-409(+)